MISIVIPTHNMSEYLAPLLESLVQSTVVTLIEEVIIVDDGSTDETPQVLKDLQTTPPWKRLLKILTLSSNQGRFEARKLGALQAKGDLIFFIDTRIRLPLNSGTTLKELLIHHSQLMGFTWINTTKSVFNLYWERSHQWIFRKHYENGKSGFYLTSENYETFAKGTGLLIVKKSGFLQACETLSAFPVLADDTLLIREIVRMEPLFVCDRFFVEWEPRQNWKDFLLRIIGRGPGFVEYHFFTRRTRFFYASVFAAIFGLAVLTIPLLIFSNMLSGILMGVLILIALGSGSVLLLTQNPVEIFKLVPLHLLVLCCFTLGIIYGLFHFLTRQKRSLS